MTESTNTNFAAGEGRQSSIHEHLGQSEILSWYKQHLIMLDSKLLPKCNCCDIFKINGKTNAYSQDQNLLMPWELPAVRRSKTLPYLVIRLSETCRSLSLRLVMLTCLIGFPCLSEIASMVFWKRKDWVGGCCLVACRQLQALLCMWEESYQQDPLLWRFYIFLSNWNTRNLAIPPVPPNQSSRSEVCYLQYLMSVHSWWRRVHGRDLWGISR
jgi:hypothetical protein